jgi:hypothetical protein
MIIRKVHFDALYFEWMMAAYIFYVWTTQVTSLPITLATCIQDDTALLRRRLLKGGSTVSGQIERVAAKPEIEHIGINKKARRVENPAARSPAVHRMGMRKFLQICG